MLNRGDVRETHFFFLLFVLFINKNNNNVIYGIHELIILFILCPPFDSGYITITHLIFLIIIALL